MSNPLCCPFCRSAQVIPNATVEDNTGRSLSSLKARIGFLEPGSWVNEQPVHAELVGDLCCGCGRVTLRVAEPAALWHAYQSLLANGGKLG